jgi:hypothetical protein
MVHELQLFDKNLKPQNIAFSTDGPGEHTIQLSPTRIGKRKQSQDTVGMVNDMSKAEISAQDSKMGLDSKALQSVANRTMQQSEEDGISSSPRSNYTEEAKLVKQKARLEEMKNDALSKMLGLNHFIFMMWSKDKFDWDCEDSELLVKFHKRYSNCLPIDYIDMILVDDLREKPIILTGT